MAKVTEKRGQPEPPPVIGYTLELTVDEAEKLSALLYNYAPMQSAVYRIRRALCDAGVKPVLI